MANGRSGLNGLIAKKFTMDDGLWCATGPAQTQPLRMEDLTALEILRIICTDFVSKVTKIVIFVVRENAIHY